MKDTATKNESATRVSFVARTREKSEIEMHRGKDLTSKRKL